MRCRDIDALGSAYIDGELDDARSSAVRGHLRVCASCRDQIADLAAIRDGAARLDPIDPPAELWSRIEDGLARAEIADADRSRLWLHWQTIRPRLLPGAVIACAAVLAVLWLDRQFGDRLADDPPPARTAAMAPAASDPTSGGGGAQASPTAADRSARSATAVGDPVGDAAGGPDAVGAATGLSAAQARSAAAADRRYRATIAELRDLVAEERVAWPAEFAAVVADRLTEFDRAAEREQARIGRASGPASRDALHAIYFSEIEFLQTLVVDGVIVATAGQPNRRSERPNAQ